MYSFSDVDSVRLSDEDASGDTARRSRLLGQQVESALTFGFGETMRKLKEGNELTLDLCNRLRYQESKPDAQEDDEELEELESGSDYEFQEEQPFTDTSKKSAPFFIGSDSELLNKSVGSMQNILAKNLKDNVRDFTTADGAQDSPKTTKGVRLDPRPRIRCFETSLSENDDSEHERYVETRAATIHNDTLQSAMARIEDMWGAFTVDDYAPWSSFKPSANGRGEQSPTKCDPGSRANRSVTGAWKKKSTVTDPPTMLIRDANKTLKKTRAMVELDQEREERKHLEEMECRKQFRAQAAPDHIRLRLLEEMNRQEEERRMSVRNNGEEILKSIQKPFQFIEREEQKKRERLREMLRSSGKRSVGHFRARPFPAHIFNGTAEDKILEEEEYRRIRMRMRAEELLNSSFVPFSMRVRDKVERRSGKTEIAPREANFQPQVNQTLPDLDEQYQRFMEQMMKRKERKKPTACKPFNLRLSRAAPRKRALPGSTSHDAARLSRQRSLGNRHARDALSLSLGAIPTQPRDEARWTGRQRSKQRSRTQKARNGALWNALPGDVVYSLEDSDDLIRSRESPDLLQPGSSKQKQGHLDGTYEGTDQPAPNDSGPLNLTYELQNSNGDDNSSEKAPSDFWSHPSLVRRSEFWSNPVASVH